MRKWSLWHIQRTKGLYQLCLMTAFVVLRWNQWIFWVIRYFLLQIFRGNDDADTPVEEELDCPVFAKGIRVIPLEWEPHIALRFDVKGCYLDTTVIGTNSSNYCCILGHTYPSGHMTFIQRRLNVDATS